MYSTIFYSASELNAYLSFLNPLKNLTHNHNPSVTYQLDLHAHVCIINGCITLIKCLVIPTYVMNWATTHVNFLKNRVYRLEKKFIGVKTSSANQLHITAHTSGRQIFG